MNINDWRNELEIEFRRRVLRGDIGDIVKEGNWGKGGLEKRDRVLLR